MTNFANKSGMSLLDFRYANAVRNALGNDSGTMKDLYQVMEDTASDYPTLVNSVPMQSLMKYVAKNKMAKMTSQIV